MTDSRTENWELLQYPNPRLRLVSEEVAEITDDVKQKALALSDLTISLRGVGLAAPQVGWRVRIVCVNLSGEAADSLIFVNPKLTNVSADTFESYEGCLSVPGIFGKVTRPRQIEVSSMNLEGQSNTFVLDGAIAKCLQHEMDHLDGKLFIDRLSPAKKQAIKSKLKKLEGK